MITVSLAEAKARLGELLEKAEAGEDVLVTRDGKAVARISAAETGKRPIDFEGLASLRASMPRLKRASSEILRDARDESR